MLKKILPYSLILFSSAAFAEQNPLSVHVLNLENGLPSANVEVVLEKILESQKIIDILEDIDYDTEEIKSILKGRLQEDIYKDLEKYLNENSYLKTIWSYYE